MLLGLTCVSPTSLEEDREKRAAGSRRCRGRWGFKGSLNPRAPANKRPRQHRRSNRVSVFRAEQEVAAVGPRRGEDGQTWIWCRTWGRTDSTGRRVKPVTSEYRCILHRGRQRVRSAPRGCERAAERGRKAGGSSPLLGSGPPAAVGAVWPEEYGRGTRLPPPGLRSVRSAVRAADGRRCPLCAGGSLKWASLQDRLGCSGAPCAAARFPLPGLQRPHVGRTSRTPRLTLSSRSGQSVRRRAERRGLAGGYRALRSLAL